MQKGRDPFQEQTEEKGDEDKDGFQAEAVSQKKDVLGEEEESNEHGGSCWDGFAPCRAAGVSG